MEQRDQKSDQKIYEAAVRLFDRNGFHGTTIRQIAKEAGVNLALISYYYKNKKGLLEHVMIRYFEPLFTKMEEKKGSKESPVAERIMEMLAILVHYQQDHARITRIIQRELSLETMLSREIMSIYLTRLKHYFISTLEEAVEKGQLAPLNIDFAVISLLGMVQYPYLNPQWVREVFYLEPSADSFSEQMCNQIRHFVFSSMKKNEEN